MLSSFSDAPGTLVCDEDEIVEKELVSGIAYSRDEAKVTLVAVSDQPGIAAGIFTILLRDRTTQPPSDDTPDQRFRVFEQ